MNNKTNPVVNGAPRPYQFSPLRRGWIPEGDAPHYQQQLMAGFQQGVSDGFAQGQVQGQQQGYDEGWRSGRGVGLRQGIDEGKTQAHSLFVQASQPLEMLIRQLQTALDEHEQRRRTELLQLVDKVARQVIRCELALQPTQLLALVEESLNSLPEAPTRLRVLLNPEELMRISDAEPEKVAQWGLCPEPELAPGECRVITESAELDIGCHHRLEQCIDALQQNLNDRPEG